MAKQTSTFRVKLFLKLDRIKSDGTASISARIRLAGKKMELISNQSILPEFWDDKAESVINHPERHSINAHIQSFKAQISNAYSQLYIARQEITLDAIRALVQGEEVIKTVKLLEVAQEHNIQFNKLVGIKYSYGSYKNYKTTLKYLEEFIPQFFGKEDIPLNRVDFKFCEAFYVFLTTYKKCHNNGANKQIQRVKKLINYSIRLGHIQNNPMASYALEFKPYQRIALSLEEIKRIADLKIQNKTLGEVRDVFLLQCYTGLSYSDVKALSREHVLQGGNDTIWIKMKRQKTSVAFAIPLLAEAYAILKKYINYVDLEQHCMPVLSNQKMNQHLKLIQELSGIGKTLTTHLARHTFATTITLSNGVPIETVSRMLGHTKLSTTQVYAKVLDNKVQDDMEGLSKKLKGKI